MQTTGTYLSRAKILLCIISTNIFFISNINSQTVKTRIYPQSPEKNYEEILNLAENDTLAGEFEKGIFLYKKSAELAKQANSPKDEAFSLIKLGDLYWNTGKLQEPIESYKRASLLAETYLLSKELDYCRKAIGVHTLYMKADSSLSSKQYQPAIELIDSAIQLSREVKNVGFEIKCLRLKSLISWDTNKLKEFLVLNTNALQLAKKIRHKEEEAKSLNNIGLFYWKTDNYSEALNSYEKALEIAKSIGNQKNESECMNNLSLVFWDIGTGTRTSLIISFTTGTSITTSRTTSLTTSLTGGSHTSSETGS